MPNIKRYIPHDIRCILQRVKNGRKPFSKAAVESFGSEGNYSPDGYYRTRSIFVHIPKAAGISITKGLYGDMGMGHKTIRNYQLEFFKRDFDSFFKFTFVRNPWDRLFSAYNFLQKGGLNSLDAAWAKEHLADIVSFEDFVMNWMNENRRYSIIHFQPQVDFLKSYTGNVPLDFIGRYETIQDDYEYIRNAIAAGDALEHRNKTVDSENLSYKDAYTPEMIAKVKRLYADDIELLGYDF